MEKATIEIWVLVDESGDAGIGLSADDARDNYNDTIDNSGVTVSRMVKVTLSVPLPVAVALTGDVPAEAANGAALQVA